MNSRPGKVYLPPRALNEDGPRPRPDLMGTNRRGLANEHMPEGIEALH